MKLTWTIATLVFIVLAACIQRTRPAQAHNRAAGGEEQPSGVVMPARRGSIAFA